jgi:hypothetical protein
MQIWFAAKLERAKWPRRKKKTDEFLKYIEILKTVFIRGWKDYRMTRLFRNVRTISHV